MTHARKIQPSKILKNIGAVLWIAAACEIFLRILAPIPILPRFIQAGDFGIRVNTPNESYWHTTPDYRIQIRTNAAGMRADVEFPKEHPKGRKRIVLLGDSFGLGHGVALEDSYPQRVEEKLSTQGIDAETINLSVSGLGTSEQMLTLENKGMLYQPDLVVATWHTSDVQDDVRANLHRIGASGLERSAKIYLPAVKIREFLFSFGAYRFLAENSQSFNWIRENAGRVTKSLLVDFRDEDKRARAATRSQRRDNLSASNESDEPRNWAPRTHRDLNMAVLAAMAALCKSQGIPFLVCAIPTRLDRSEFKDNFPYDLANQQDFAVVSPISHFRRHKGKQLYWEQSHGHWTPLGCDLVADTLTEKIIAEKWLN